MNRDCNSCRDEIDRDKSYPLWTRSTITLRWRQLQNNHRLNGCRWTWSISVLNQDCLFRLKSFNNRTSSIYMIHIIWTSSKLSRSRLLHIIRYYWRLNYIAESNSLIASCGMIYAIKNLVGPFQISFISDVSLA